MTGGEFGEFSSGHLFSTVHYSASPHLPGYKLNYEDRANMTAPAPSHQEPGKRALRNLIPLESLILPPRSATLDSSPPIVRTTIAGDPTVGTITYLRQTHTIYTEEKTELIEIGRFQQEMLKVLEEGQFRHVFAEGLVKNFYLGDPKDVQECGIYHFNLLKENARLIGSPNDPGRFVEWTKALFTSSDYPKLSPEPLKREQQLITLGILGAHFVYACTNPTITLHRTMAPRLDHRLYERQRALDPLGKRGRYGLAEDSQAQESQR